MRSVFLGLTFVAAAGLASRPAAPGRLIDAPEEYTYGCTAEEAKPVPFRDLQRNPAAFLRKCVRVEGIGTVGREFYADEGDVYRHITQLVTGDVQGIGIGLYASKRSTIELGERARTEIVGRAFSCSEIYTEVKAAQDEKYAESKTPLPPPMLAGYCHYYGDAIIYVARSRILTPGPLRLTGTDAAKAFGDIDDLRPSDDRYNEVWKRVTEWFDAVRRPNSPQFKDYATDHCAPVASGDRLTRECGAEIEERFAFLRNGLPPAIKFYSRRTKPLYGPQSDYLALGCVCRTANCEGQWPIHSVDTSSSAWPYVCVHVSREGSEFKVY